MDVGINHKYRRSHEFERIEVMEGVGVGRRKDENIVNIARNNV